MAAPRVDGVVPPNVAPSVQPVGVPNPTVNPQSLPRTDSTAESTETVETTGWEAADETYDQHEVGLKRRQKWSGFSGSNRFGLGTSDGSEPTAPYLAEHRAPQSGPGTFQAPPRQLGEPPLNYYMRFSAALNEYFRAYGEKVGVATYGFSPGNEPSVLLRRGNLRRKFELE